MNRKLILSTLLSVCMGASAQQVTTGQVTDRAGNPISGARVEAKGTTYSTTTGIDGRFTLESPVPFQKVKVSSAGKNSRTQYVSANTVVQLSDPSWLNTKPTGYRWFVSPQVAFIGSDSKDTPFGLMGGVVKDFGVYAKFMYSGMPSTSGGTASGRPSASGNISDNLWGTSYKTGFMAATGGVMVRLGAPIYLMVGAGYAKRKVALERITGEYIEAESYYDNYGDEVKVSGSGLAVDAMLMVEYKHFTLSGGTTMWKVDKSHFTMNLGIGYMF